MLTGVSNRAEGKELPRSIPKNERTGNGQKTSALLQTEGYI